MHHFLSRTELLVGPEGVQRLASSRVAVFGVGGVGGYVVEALTRAGVGSLLIADNDLVCLTNLNRQIHALHSTVGRPKVEVMKQRMLDINPALDVQCYDRFYLPGQADEVLAQPMDYLVDAIDTVTAKLDLIVEARKRSVPVISCMGTGNRLDASRLRVADISETHGCPLAKVMRKELRTRGITTLKVVFSDEPAIKPGAREANEDNGWGQGGGESGTGRGQGMEQGRGQGQGTGTGTGTGRRQIPGSISYVPAVAGLLMASEVIRELLAG